MAKSHTLLPNKILVNAEEFGFGPAAAIADFFPHLRKRFEHIAYIGSGHSLDLQTSFAYDAIYEKDNFESVLADYDLFFTALDFDKAKRAAVMGKPTAIYDSLCWYWPTLPDVISKDVLYLAQAFHGVKERLAKEKEMFANAVTVNPIIPIDQPQRERSIVLLNMGGLQNPYWPLELCIAYATSMIRAFKESVGREEHCVILCSSKIAQGIPDAKSLKRDEVVSLLPKVKYAVQTPGLSNIFDVAAMDIPTVFIPPANDSQGQQLELLLQHRQVDAYIDWKDLSPLWDVDYKGKQRDVVDAIANNVRKLRDEKYDKKLKALFRDSIAKIANKKKSAVSTLIDQYGKGGAEEVVEHITNFAKKQELIIV